MTNLYQVTYTMPGQPTVTDRGLTREAASRLQDLVLRGGGVGCCQQMAVPAPTLIEAIALAEKLMEGAGQ
jgi:hypothetical protein